MNTRTIKISLLLLASTVPAFAQTFSVDWSTIDDGGVMASASNSFTVSGTIGQPDAQVAPVMASGSFQVTGGFWPVTQVCSCPGDMNGDGKRDGRDIQQFVNCFLVGGNCSCADIDGANGIDPADISSFVTNLLNAGACP